MAGTSVAGAAPMPGEAPEPHVAADAAGWVEEQDVGGAPAGSAVSGVAATAAGAPVEPAADGPSADLAVSGFAATAAGAPVEPAEGGAPVEPAASRVGARAAGAPVKPAAGGALVEPPASRPLAAGTIPFLARWMSHVCRGTKSFRPVSADSFFSDLSNGLVLCRVVKQLVPGSDFSKGMSERPVAEKSCIANLEKALSCAWRQGVRATKMCTARDFLLASTQKRPHEVVQARKAVVSCCTELFLVLQMRQRSARARSLEVLADMQQLLVAMDRPMSAAALSGDIYALHEDFAGGTRVMALLIATGRVQAQKVPRLREERHCGDDLELWVKNGEVLSQTLADLGCPLLLAPAEWRSPPQPFPESLLFQLLTIWEFCTGPRDEPGAAPQHPVAHFVEFISERFGNFDRAFPLIAQHHGDRLSRTAFFAAMQVLQYSGDAKFVWQSLDTGTHSGFADFRSWSGLRQSVLAMAKRSSQPPSAPPAAGALAADADPLLAEQAVATDAAATPATTSVHVQILLTDQSRRHVRLQTRVLDAAVDAGEAEEPRLVLEVRERSSLCSVVDVAQLLGVEQLDADLEGAALPQSFSSYVVAMRPEAELHGAGAAQREDVLEGQPRRLGTLNLFHEGRGGSVLLCFAAGPTPALREEARRFFDELRIKVYFMRRPPAEDAGDVGGPVQ